MAMRFVRQRIYAGQPAERTSCVVGDVDGDGRPELYFWNQGSQSIFCLPLPDDPMMSPWPGLTVVAAGVSEEGLAVGDVDGDGRDELIAGQSWYRRRQDGGWDRYVYSEAFLAPRVVAADKV